MGILHTEIAKIAKTDLGLSEPLIRVGPFLCDLCDLCVNDLF